jgi:hypothetical protein
MAGIVVEADGDVPIDIFLLLLGSSLALSSGRG